MPKILQLYFDPDNRDAEKPTSIVVDMGWAGNCRWKVEMVSRKADKKHYKEFIDWQEDLIRGDGDQQGEVGGTEKKSKKWLGWGPLFYGEGS